MSTENNISTTDNYVVDNVFDLAAAMNRMTINEFVDEQKTTGVNEELLAINERNRFIRHWGKYKYRKPRRQRRRSTNHQPRRTPEELEIIHNARTIFEWDGEPTNLDESIESWEESVLAQQDDHKPKDFKTPDWHRFWGHALSRRSLQKFPANDSLYRK